MSGRGSRSRRNSNTRKCEGASDSSGEVGLAVKIRAAKGPACESSRAAAGGSSSRRMERKPNSSTALDAGRCQPRVVSSWGSSSSSLGADVFNS